LAAIRTICLTLATAAILATPAAASEDDWPVLKGARLDGLRPWSAFAVYRAESSTGVSLYLRGAELVARRVEVRGAATTIDWASSRACPQLSMAAARMESLPVPRIEAPGVGRSPRGGPPRMDGDSYFLWADDARFTGDRHSAQLELRGVNGSPMAAWADRTLISMATCWRTTQP